MAAQPQQREVLECLLGEDRLDVELDVGLTGERDVVAQQSQRQAVGDNAPEPLGRAVEEFLHEAVGRLLGGAVNVRGAAIQRYAGPDEMDRAVLPLAEHWKGLRLDLRTGLLDQPTVAQLREEGKRPALAGQAAGRVALGRLFALGAEHFPGRCQARPRLRDRLAYAFARAQVR